MRISGSALRRTVGVTVTALVAAGATAGLTGVPFGSPFGAGHRDAAVTGARPAASAPVAAADAAPSDDAGTGSATSVAATGADGGVGTDGATDAGAPGPAPRFDLRSLPLEQLTGEAARRGSVDGTTYLRVRVPAGTDAGALQALLDRFDAHVHTVGTSTSPTTYAVPDARAAGFRSAVRALTRAATVEPDHLMTTFLTVPDDSSTQWWFSQIGIGKAWDVEKGDPAVSIAVVDTGVDVNHPDLKSKVVGRYNAVTGTTDVTDTVGHGTFVAGVAAAATDNGVGIAGIGWSSSILAVKVADSNGRILGGAVAKGVRWAADHGAAVVNLSLGSTVNDPLVSDAVTYARGKGVVVVASAGNFGQSGNMKIYPAALSGVISVGATFNGYRAPFSEYGSWVTMAAPGVKIRGTAPTAGSQLFAKGYDTADGTSFAAPQVAGTAALMLAREPNATPAQVRAALVASATGFTGFGLGAGRLNAQHALWELVPHATPSITAPAASATVTSYPTWLTASGLPTAAKVAWSVDGVSLGAPVAVEGRQLWDPRGFSTGTHTIQARACSIAGRCVGATVTRTVTVAVPKTQITEPADGATVGGRVAVVADSSAPDTRVLVDGSPVAELRYEAEGRFVDLGAVADGSHTLQVVACGTVVRTLRCDGARSTPVSVTVQSTKPTVTVSNPTFTPNGDGVKDTTTVTVKAAPGSDAALELREVVGGGLAVRFALGTVPAGGTVTRTWDGKNSNGVRFDGLYDAVVVTTSGSGVHGYGSTRVRADRTTPGAAPHYIDSRTFYPVKDGYKDTVPISFTTQEKATATVAIRNAAGRTVRTLTATTPDARQGVTTVTWNGRTAAGTLLPAGTYSARISTRDLAGLTSTGRWYPIVLSTKKLVTRTTTLTRSGTSAYGIGNGRSCATATDAGSSFAKGLWIKNRCAKNVAAPFPAFALWRFSVPGAVRYSSFTVSSRGRSHSQPADVGAGVMSTMTNDFEMPYPLRRVKTNAVGTITVGKVTGPGHAPGRRTAVMLYVLNTNTPLNDWDVATVRLTVRYVTLG